MIIRDTFAAAGVALLICGCAEQSGQVTTQAIAPINITEPGDTSMPCPKLNSEIAAVAANLSAVQESVRGQETSQAVSAAAKSAMPAPQVPNTGMLAALTIMSQSADAMGVQQLSQDRDRMFKLQQRRDYLVELYNTRCQAKKRR